MHYWHPTHCTLQLNFVQPDAQRDGGSAPLAAGDAYSGRSSIRYLRRSFSRATTQETFPAADVKTNDGLHFHAITAPTPELPRARPLVIHSFKVQPQLASSGAGALKVLKVVESGLCGGDSGGAERGKQRGAASNGGRARRDKKTKGKAHDAKDPAHQGRPDADTEQRGCADPGSKHVFFEGGASMPVGSSVTLVIAFTGRIQGWDQGGIYTNDNAESAAGAARGVLLTHFEVALARLAFPCPDDAQHYRLIWQLQSLQLPSSYSLVVSNTARMSEKAMGGRGTQHTFSPVGPIPAYALAFAAFSGSVEMVEELLRLRGSPTTAAAGRNADEKLVPLRVVAATSSGVTSHTLRRIADIVQEAVQLLEDYFAAPLPLQQMPFSHDLEWREELLTIVLAPTMPYISGMEHHGCIFLNEAIYRSSACDGSARGPGKHHDAGAGGTTEASRVELIVHELAHHWVGNTLGMPFVLKEGVCLLLEQCFGDVIMGRPMRSITPSGANIMSATAVPSRAVAPPPTTTTVTAAEAGTAVVVVDTEKGKEFTGHSYQKALNTLRDVVSGMGFAAFKERMQRMYQTEVTGGIKNGCAVDGNHHADALVPPYITAPQFLAYMET
ncbi:putative aminopeptidase, putative,metallo-peptidase, clan MA(E), family M1 [Trypanosoma rangeli]|uniref:Putative aminopeptidase, putative,metallo-peptidase, clan MA(E), family M1 n=1 Tax=Trypanosoma rangeli TaxID=5698 RepID=A0A422N3Z8_TRYRA|nr:putative aminopeptidase, putative,metallo-peptidase, clan MA(E), family M1 [Trypanosoma rangeli]RNF00195.1 putative aminopeptidase, putative,metallo-peptidase, clan MA(E), family M1 [Trypanosoma rangeli]|eukprot:RNF00195.1 putative aminopeptidase, putative,metallo-peptidase, clan MA(E), family M1 [Trypanosoma rangeli]